MAAVVLSAELKLRDGQIQKVCARVENNLSSLINGINELNMKVSQLLSDLMQRERGRRVCAEGEEEEEDCDEDEEDPQSSEPQPPAKKLRT